MTPLGARTTVPIHDAEYTFALISPSIQLAPEEESIYILRAAPDEAAFDQNVCDGFREWHLRMLAARGNGDVERWEYSQLFGVVGNAIVHGGMLDRVDSIRFSAPIFFHIVRYWWA